jgi:hypothetical protein
MTLFSSGSGFSRRELLVPHKRLFADGGALILEREDRLRR